METPTHKVIDLIYHEDNEVFEGTYQECLDWRNKQGMFGYEILPTIKEQS